MILRLLGMSLLTSGEAVGQCLRDCVFNDGMAQRPAVLVNLIFVFLGVLDVEGGLKPSKRGLPSGRGPQRCPAMRRLNSFRHVLAARCWTASVVTEGFKMTLNCSSSFLFRVRVNVTAHVCNYQVFGHITSSHFVCSHLTQSSLVTLGFKTSLSYLAGVSFRVRVNSAFHVHSYEVFGHLQSSFITELLILLNTLRISRDFIFKRFVAH